MQLVTTTGWETPTSFNTQPLRSIGSGRGSLVFYNQGSFFNWMFTGYQKLSVAVSALGRDEIQNVIHNEAAKIMQ